MKTTQSNCLKFRLFIEISNHNKSCTFLFSKKKQNKTNLKQWHACVRWLADFILIVQLLIAVVIVSFVLHEIGRTAYYQWLQDPVVGKPKKSNKCSLKTCRQHGLMPFVCPDCRKNHCIRWETFDWHLQHEKKSFFFSIGIMHKTLQSNESTHLLLETFLPKMPFEASEALILWQALQKVTLA